MPKCLATSCEISETIAVLGTWDHNAFILLDPCDMIQAYTYACSISVPMQGKDLGEKRILGDDVG